MNYDPLLYYAQLDIPENADEHTLKLSYRDKAKFWHPDHNKAANALEEFQKISIAYDVLKDKHSRKIYDLLALAYDAKTFPDMKSLKIYKAVDGQETPFLRVFKLQKVNKNGICEENLVGTFSDALSFIQHITQENWRKIFLYPRSGIKALKNNFRQIGANREDNFKLLLHNAAAFYSEGKNDKAGISAVQALEYATVGQKGLLEKFIAELPPFHADFPVWNYRQLKNIQLKIPVFIVAAIGIILLATIIAFFGKVCPEDKNHQISYYQEVRFSGGGETVDDMVVAKIFNIPVDTADTSRLYHVTANVKVMYGPSDEFDVLVAAKRGQTFRITGYTPDNIWYRVMLDNGEMGFIRKQYLKKGIGLEIPAGSKIFQTLNE